MENKTVKHKLTTPKGLAERYKRQSGQLAAINSVVTAISQTLDLNQTLQQALDAVLSIIPLESSGISLIDEKAGELVMRAQRGLTYDFVSEPMRIKLGHGISGDVIRTGEVAVIRGDVGDDPRLYVPNFALEKTQAMALVPMHARGKVIGVLSVMSHSPYNFSTQEIGVLRMIADQVGLAIDNARLFEELKGQQSRMEAVLHSTADAIIATDLKGKINLFNHAAEKLFSLNGDSLMNQHIKKIGLPEDIAEHMCQTIRGNLSHDSFEATLPNGRYLAILMSHVYSENPMDERQINGWVTVFQDITHLKEAERARLQFIQTAAHDLKNPLGVTLSALTMLQRGWKNPTSTETEVFSIALTGINRMQDLIDDVMNLERLQSGVDMRHEPIDIPDLIERCVIDVKPMLQRKEQVLKLDIDMALPDFIGDDRWLYRALMNLLSNAHKYTPEHSEITIRAQRSQYNLVLEVSDNGPGIPLDAQPHLCEPFYRVPRTEKIPGTGLGLAMVKHVCEQHGGAISVISEPEVRGATFRMTLPYPQRDTETIDG